MALRTGDLIPSRRSKRSTQFSFPLSALSRHQKYIENLSWRDILNLLQAS